MRRRTSAELSSCAWNAAQKHKGGQASLRPTPNPPTQPHKGRTAANAVRGSMSPPRCFSAPTRVIHRARRCTCMYECTLTMYAHKNTFGVQNRVSSAPRVARAFQTYRPRMIWVWVQGHRHHQAHHPRAPQPFLFLEGIPLVKGYLEARDTFGGIPLARDTFSRNTLSGHIWPGTH